MCHIIAFGHIKPFASEAKISILGAIRLPAPQEESHPTDSCEELKE
jgi:hypothetical protein